MKRKSKGTEQHRRPSTSSITVSDRIVCEDEACIGKAVTPIAEPYADKVCPDKKDRKTRETSISIGGEEACADDACIGKS